MSIRSVSFSRSTVVLFGSMIFQAYISHLAFLLVMPFFSSEKVAESRVVLFLETEDIEAAVSKAVSAGAVVESKIADSDGPYVGNRVAKLKDPFGFTWLIGTPAKESPVGEV